LNRHFTHFEVSIISYFPLRHFLSSVYCSLLKESLFTVSYSEMALFILITFQLLLQVKSQGKLSLMLYNINPANKNMFLLSYENVL